MKKVIDWVNFYADYPEADEFSDEYNEYEAALVEHIKENKICINGNDHQYGERCAPLFDDGKKLTTSMRHWGAIMYEAWKDSFDDVKDGMGYARFAWWIPERMQKKFPKDAIDKVPGTEHGKTFGSLAQSYDCGSVNVLPLHNLLDNHICPLRNFR